MAKKSVAKEIPVLTENEIMKVGMKTRGLLQVELADRLGMRQSSLSGSMNRNRISLEVFNTMLNAMDYDVAVVDRETGEVMWKVALK